MMEDIHKIAEYYGLNPQMDVLIEEMAELIKALSKYKRITNVYCPKIVKEDAIANIAEEIADVEIMLEQVKYLLNITQGDIERIKEKKVLRTLEYISKDKETDNGREQMFCPVRAGLLQGFKSGQMHGSGEV